MFRRRRLLTGNNVGSTDARSFAVQLQSSLLPSRAAGSNTPTFTRATAARVLDWEGLLKPVLSGEARFTGARRVENLVKTTSEDFSNAAWNKDATVSVTGGQTDPVGGTGAYKIDNTTAGNGIYNDNLAPAYAIGVPRRVSVWLKGNAGGETVNIGKNGGNNVTITTSWARYAVLDASGNQYCVIRNQGANGTIFAYQVLDEVVVGQSNQNPSEYVSKGVLSTPYHGAGVDGVKYFTTKNGNTVASNVVTEATGAAITPANGGSTLTCDTGGPFGYLAEGARTNLCLQSQTFGTTWSAGGNSIVSDAVAAPDGTTTADRLQETAASSTHLTTQAITTGNAQYTFSVYLKDGGRTYAFVAMSDNTTGNVYVYVNLSTGAITQAAAATGSWTSPSATITALPNSWYKVTITGTAGAGTQVVCRVGNDNTGTGGENANSYAGDITKGCYAWGAQLEAAPFASTYIPTTTVSVTRNTDDLRYSSTGNANLTVGSAYSEGLATSIVNGGGYVNFANTTYPIGQDSIGRTNAYDGTNNVNVAGAGASTTTVNKRAASWGGSTMVSALNGVTASGSFDGAMTGATIDIGNPQVTPPFATIRNVRMYSTAFSAAQLATMTT